MKAFFVPASVLALILSLSLLSCAYAQRCVERTTQRLEQADEAADSGAWEAAERLILAAHQEWIRHDATLHMILQHQELDETEKLFVGVLAACREREAAQTQILLQQLLAQLGFLVETQSASWENVF